MHVAVFDFATDGGEREPEQGQPAESFGRKLADSVRLKLRRQGPQWQVIDGLTMRESGASANRNTPLADVRVLMAEQLGAQIAIFGTVRKQGQDARAKIVIIDARPGTDQPVRQIEIGDGTQRANAIISDRIVQAVTGKPTWIPPQYGDEPAPPREKLGKPLNTNSTFDGTGGWETTDNVSTFIQPGQDGNVLRIKTDLQRNAWIEYRKALRMGTANPANPPAIPQDATYSSVAGLEGVHFRSQLIPARPGQRYWLMADVMPLTPKADPAGMFFPKVFVKGFRRTEHALDGLSESTLFRLGLTPQQFAAMPKASRDKIIAEDAKANPTEYLRECYRWYLPCRSKQGQWNHFAAPFPPRGGLPADVEYLQIQIYTYWPPGEYLWDNVTLFADPDQQTPPAKSP